MNLKNKMRILDVIFSLAVPAVIVFIFLMSLLTKPGYVFYGDEEWPLRFYMSNSINSILYSWASGSPTSSNGIVFTFFIVALVKIFGVYLANKLTVFLLPFLSGPLAYFSIIGLLNTYKKYDNPYIARIAALVGTVFYVSNWQNPSLITPIYSWAFSYMISPVLLMLIFRIYKEHRVTDIFYFSLISVLGDSVPLWIITTALLITVLLGSKIFRSDRRKELVLSVRDTALLLIFTFLANAYFLSESLAGFLIGAGGQYATYSSVASSIAVAKGSSFFTFFDVFVYGQSSYYFFGINPKNWSPLNFAIPILVIVFLIWILFERIRFNHKEKLKFSSETTPYTVVICALLIILTITLFLAKGFNPPFGRIYYYVLKFSPSGVLGITRDVGPFLMISSLAYSVLFAVITLLALDVFVNHSNEEEKPAPSGLRSRYKVRMAFAVVAVALIIFSSVAIFNETNTTLSQTYERFNPTYIPENMTSTVNFIDSQQLSGNIMWMPTGSTYPWKNNYLLTGFGTNLVRNASSPLYIYNYLFNQQGKSLGKVLDLSDTQYLIYDENASFAFNYPVTLNSSQILSLLHNQTDMSLIYNKGSYYIFKNLARPANMYVGTPNLGNPYASVYNFSAFPIAGGNLYVNNSNSYIALYNAGQLTPYGIKNINGSIPADTATSVSFLKYEYTPTLYYYNETAFTLINHTQNGQNITVTLNYTIPKFLRQYSGSGEFSPSFFLEAKLYRANDLQSVGTNEYSYKQLAFNQTLSTNTTGSVTFNLPYVSNTSLYINYYFGGFRLASPFYYICTFEQNGSLKSIPVKPLLHSSHDIVYNYYPYNSSFQTELYASVPVIFNDNNTLCLNYSATLAAPAEVISFNQTNVNSIIKNFNLNLVPEVLQKTSGSILTPVNLKRNFSLIHGDTASVLAETPIDANFTVFVNVSSGEIEYNGINYTSGNYFLHKYIANQSVLNIYAVTNASFSVKIFESNNIDSGTITNISEVTPAYYSAHVRWNGTALLVLPQQYSALWVLEYNGRSYHAIPIYGGAANGFILDNPNGTVKVKFEMQNALDLGYIVTGSFSAVSLIALVLYRRKNK